MVAKSGSENEFDVRIETASAESIIESSTRDQVKKMSKSVAVGDSAPLQDKEGETD